MYLSTYVDMYDSFLRKYVFDMNNFCTIHLCLVLHFTGSNRPYLCMLNNEHHHHLFGMYYQMSVSSEFF